MPQERTAVPRPPPTGPRNGRDHPFGVSVSFRRVPSSETSRTGEPKTPCSTLRVMSHPLYGAMMKLKRANEHLKVLYDHVNTFLHEPPDPYLVTVEPDEQHLGTGTDAADKFRLVLKPGTKLVPTMEWGTMVGDILHNLRSALDHLAWELTVANSGPAPADPVGGKWKRVGFPILTDRARWSDLGMEAVWGIGPDPAARIEELQPYNTGQDAPERQPLAVLHELWNRDKHRTVAVVVDMLEFRGLATPPLLPGSPQITTRVLQRRPIGPVEDGAVLAVVAISPSAPIDIVREYVKMNVSFTFDVAFEDGPPAHGEKLIAGIERLSDVVKLILLEFSEKFFPG